MCVYSMVHDAFEPKIPVPTVDPFVPVPWFPAIDTEAVKKIVRDFLEAGKAAETVDRLTGQPDCVDPEKATLIERVRELERRLAALEATVGTK